MLDSTLILRVAQVSKINNKCIIDVSDSELQNQFSYFMSKYEKSYANDDEQNLRYQIFKNNYRRIEEHNLNNKALGYTLRMNQFGDLTLKEFTEKITGQSFDENTESHPSESVFDYGVESPTDLAIRELRIPARVNWTENGIVTSIKDQTIGRTVQCNAGYAFAAIAAIESAAAIAGKPLTEFSPQQIIECTDTADFKNNGWTGGMVNSTFRYVNRQPLCKESEYPYNGKEASCKDWKTCSVGAYVRNQVNVTSGDRLSLYTAIAQQPVSVKVDISSFAFQFYGAGILDLGCNNEKATHFATAVGYGSETTTVFFFWTKEVKFLLLKNSMGEGWGESGYVKN